MPYVWMDETARVDAVGAGGRAMSPAVPVDAGDSMTEGGRGAHADPKTPKIPNPELAEDGKVITTEDGTYVLGEGGGSGDGSGLPDYTEASNGDVLTIDNGSPAWATPSGGSGDCNVMTIGYSTFNPSVTPEYTLDHTWQEIADAFKSGKAVVAIYYDESEEDGVTYAFGCSSIVSSIDNGGVNPCVYVNVRGQEIQLIAEGGTNDYPHAGGGGGSGPK